MKDNTEDTGRRSAGSKCRSRAVVLRHSPSKMQSATKAECREHKRRLHLHYLLVPSSGTAICLYRKRSENLLSQSPPCMRLLYEAISLGKGENLTPLWKVIAEVSQAHYLTLCWNHTQR